MLCLRAHTQMTCTGTDIIVRPGAYTVPLAIAPELLGELVRDRQAAAAAAAAIQRISPHYSTI